MPQGPLLDRFPVPPNRTDFEYVMAREKTLGIGPSRPVRPSRAPNFSAGGSAYKHGRNNFGQSVNHPDSVCNNRDIQGHIPYFLTIPPAYSFLGGHSGRLTPRPSQVSLVSSRAAGRFAEEEDDSLRGIFQQHPVIHGKIHAEQLAFDVSPVLKQLDKAAKVLGMSDKDKTAMVQGMSSPKSPGVGLRRAMSSIKSPKSSPKRSPKGKAAVRQTTSSPKASPRTPNRAGTPSMRFLPPSDTASTHSLLSPQSLRNLRSVASKISLSVGSAVGSIRRKKSSHSVSDKTRGFPVSPAAGNSNLTPSPTPNALTPSKQTTLRRRRGRFQPLSVITSGFYEPFDPFGSMGRPIQAENQSEHSSDVTDSSSVTIQAGDHQKKQPEPLEATQVVTQAASASAKQQQITADFATLALNPAPLLEDHPMLRSDPFSRSCESPLMTSTSTSQEVRHFSRKVRAFEHENRLSTPATASTAATSSPLKAIHAGSSASKNSGRSKMSNMFKGWSSSTDTSKTPSTPLTSGSIVISPDIVISPQLDRPDLERYLRITLASAARDYPSTDGFPRHPTTGRGWKHRNLRCTTCPSKSCAVCKRTCCAYKACVGGLENNKHYPEGLKEAWTKLHEITRVYPYGQEAPTFIQCTECRKWACPECVGVCPNAICQDTQCRRCKRGGVWEECAFHRVVVAAAVGEDSGIGIGGD